MKFDILPKYINSKVFFYKFKFHICKNVYVGRTKRYLLVCQYEDLGLSVFTEKPLCRKRCSGNEETLSSKLISL